jgi:adenine-specific DNA-methyltransferase
MPPRPHRRWRTTAAIQARAQQLRREMTPAEKKLWQYLRERQLDDAYFRKQAPVGRFILDFLCAKAKLVVEVDGDSHANAADYDSERTRWLNEQKDYRVIRFTNAEVLHNIGAVVEKITEALKG